MTIVSSRIVSYPWLLSCLLMLLAAPAEFRTTRYCTQVLGSQY